MELKVWVEGIQRIVCGVSETTTCQDVVFALAHATGKIGRFTLIERWRTNERLLAPNENPLKILMKWGEYSSDVQFILQQSDKPSTTITATDNNNTKSTNLQTNPNVKDIKQSSAADQQRESSSNFTKPLNERKLSSDLRKSDLVGIVKGIPQNTSKQSSSSSPSSFSSPSSSSTPPSSLIHNTIKSFNQTATIPESSNSSISSPFGFAATAIAAVPGTTASAKMMEFNSADVRSSLDRKTSTFREAINYSDDNGHAQETHHNLSDSAAEMYKNGPPISSNGALAPPPYRNPPPPRSSPPPPIISNKNYAVANIIHQKSDSLSSTNSSVTNYKAQQQQAIKSQFVKETSPSSTASNTTSPPQPPSAGTVNVNSMPTLKAIVNNAISDNDLMNDNQFQSTQYRDLLQLIKFQREKINMQQADITKYDAEIIYLENKERDQLQQLEALTREINKTDQIFRQGNEQLQTLQYVEEENELVRQQEKTLKSEITLLRSKLANCETELLQCKNKIRLLMDDIQIEQRALYRQFDSRQQMERHLLHEVERIQSEIDHAVHSSESANKTTDNLKKEVAVIESAIAEKKHQLEKLVNELKEVNLQSLAVAPSEEIRHLLESSNRPGSTRRIIGSPRQLETAVPTSKNPHGVWV